MRIRGKRGRVALLAALMAKKSSPGIIKRFFSSLGPGLITGAADDDPSGIATYSAAGAQMGTSLLWTAFITWPLMAAVQMMCARIGMVTGKGLAGALREKFPRPVLAVVSVALLAANTINVGADLTGMADAVNMLTGINPHVCVILFGAGIGYATIHFRYHKIASVLKWLALTLFSYVVTAFLVHPQWGKVAHDAFVPAWPRGHEAWAMLVAILGTTISPYLFFWQSSMEVEEEKAKGRRMLVFRQGASERDIIDRKMDVGTGVFFSNMVMFFIILTTTLTLHSHGMTKIETSRQAAEALRPFAGTFAYVLFTLGIIGVGLLSIPTLTGSAAYAFAETFHWRQGLDEKFRRARAFYAIIILSVTVGILFDFLKVNPMRALFWTAVINGLLAPFLLIGILTVACDSKIMRGQSGSLLGKMVVAVTTVAMVVAAVGMFVF